MIRTFRAELVKLRRRRVLVLAAIATVLFSIGTAAVVLASAAPAANRPGFGQGTTIEALSAADGGTEVFTTGTSFAGTFVFVVFVGAIAVEFSRGTVRTMLLRQPRRGALLAGKLASLFAFAAVVLAVAEALTWIAATLLAPTQDIPTGEWRSLAAIGHALADYAMVLFWVGGYALLGLTVAVLTRSVPVALAIGIAWAGPFEHLIQDGWNTATRVFPGLLLEAFVAGGTSDVSALRAFGTVTAYMLVAAAVAATTFVRRDVTA
jgi:ABC-type transport system involved in multi-copper enzyme maturation permease subunit